MNTLTRLGQAAAAVVLVTTLAACANTTTAAPTSTSTIDVVATTNVYGDIASQIGGSAVDVTSVISDPSQDPHSFEADARVQLAVSKAQVLIENGGGYDDWADRLLSAANNSAVTVLNVADLSGYDQSPSTGEFNEHVWYDFPTVATLVARLVTEFSAAKPADAGTFAANAATFMTALEALESREATLKSASHGEGVAITEPVPLYMLSAVGLMNVTPSDFSEAIEEGTDVSPAVLADTLALFSSGAAHLLVYNAQTEGAETTAVLSAAKAAGVPVVPVTETLPTGKSYLQWMSDNLDAIGSALG